MAPTDLIVGAGGLLGSGVARHLEETGRPPLRATRIPWGTADAAPAVLDAIGALATPERDWRVLWCAGAGVTDSSEEYLRLEAETFYAVLDGIAALPAEVRRRGAFVYASSAGGVYAGSRQPPFTEETEPAPLGAYGHAKLTAEGAVRSLTDRAGVRTLVARIANIFGPGQDLSKSQGLISRLCAAAVLRQPVSVYVSLDTLRDYIFVDDCARLFVSAADRLLATPPDTTVTKIIASGRSTSIAAVLREFQHVLRARPLVVMGASASGALQARDLRLHSVVWPSIDGRPTVTLPEGIHRTLEHVRHTLVSARP